MLGLIIILVVYYTVYEGRVVNIILIINSLSFSPVASDSVQAVLRLACLSFSAVVLCSVVLL